MLHINLQVVRNHYTSYMPELIEILRLSATVEASRATRVGANGFIRCFNPLLQFEPQHYGILCTYTKNTTKAVYYARR